MKLENCLVVAGLLLAACSGGPSTSQNTQGISCTTTADCAARGGTCVANQCRADNECASNADCSGGQTCVPDPDFGGLCATAGQPAEPLPAWSCTTGKDCPALEGCASDGKCHADGECHNTWQGGVQVGDCAGGLLCAAPDSGLAGFCTDDRNGPDPYCRSTGTGQCRPECTAAADCGGGTNTCVAGFCHRGDECNSNADCGAHQMCGLPAGWEDDGWKLCIDVPPTCVPDGQGACRLPCTVDADCIDGGSCGSDGLCHASNECKTDADCPTGTVCYSDPEFGGLCNPPR
jgi:hypothetical protein